MNWINQNLMPVLPEIVLLKALFIILLADLFIRDEKRMITYVLSLFSLVVVALVQLLHLPEQPLSAFNGMLTIDLLSQTCKFIIYLSVFAGFVYSRRYLQNKGMFKGEFFTLTLFAVFGMNIMVSATHLIPLYIGLELLSLALYALIAIQRDKPLAVEAALKYFILGALASGLLLYGISMIYGATASLDLHVIADIITNRTNDYLSVSALGASNTLYLARFGLVFVVAGLLFKLGVVPFHMWVPDVYQGAPTPVVLFVGTAPKLAAFVFIFRILAEGLGGLIKDWHSMLLLLGVLSILLGNLTAIAQTNIKRMLAYSTISHMGFILLGFACAYGAENTLPYTSALFYTISYLFMSLAAFGVLLALSNQEHECTNLVDLQGLSRTHPWLAFLMLCTMFSLAGIPPMLGFFAKFFVIEQLVGRGFITLAVFAVLMSVVGAFYYLRVVKVMYFDQPELDKTKADFCLDGKILLTLNSLLLIVLGVSANGLINWCSMLFQQFP